MKFKKTVGNIFPFFDGSRRKEWVVRSIINKGQDQRDTINIHRHDQRNVGDYYCAPHLYFDQLKDKYLDISNARSINPFKLKSFINSVSNNNLIIGGGGLLNIGHFKVQMKLFEQLAHQGKKIVIWGAGHNDPGSTKGLSVKSYDIDISAFDLAGTRDFSLAPEWVPCVSCLHPIFDRNFREDQEIGILMGKKSAKKPELANKLADYPLSSNMTNLEEMISFIGKSHILVTDSYHAMYWGILMGKKVIAIPTTSKFFDFKYKVVISSYDSFKSDLKKPIQYSGVLEECRSINLNFASKVFDHMNL